MADKNKESEYELVEITTQTAPAIKTPEGDIIDVQKALVVLLNKMEEIKKAVMD